MTRVTQSPPDPVAPDGTRGAFSKTDATKALFAAAKEAAQCKTPNGPAGAGEVKSTFNPGTGQVVIAEVVGPAFEYTSVGECVARTFLAIKIPPFDGSPVSVTKSFGIQ